ncbi:Vacuolar protein-sorting-associated protein 28 [Perkinsus olseni]|uniref:Vacuolar protein-sorting-associated protein 28 n=1 Tax=Perkinsus olseni TaxID=32597 RepID=A0A7J6PEU6_PEROL|nr:Vacuolar protein-sorting-associated protein 28 [Perkinsus olseni]
MSSSSPDSEPSLSKVALTNAERREVDAKGNLFSIIKAVDALEKAFATGLIQDESYEKQYQQLLTQYKVITTALTQGATPFDVEKFIKDNHMQVHYARVRLLGTQLPATKMYHSGEKGSPDTVHILDAGQHFVTLVDCLKMEMVSVDDLLPIVRELCGSLASISSLPVDFDAKVNIQKWLTKLNSMRATDKLSEEDARQFSLELDGDYAAFHKAEGYLSGGGGGIIYDRLQRIFRLYTTDSMYAFRITTTGQLEHLYWGPNIPPEDDLTFLSLNSLTMASPFDPTGQAEPVGIRVMD